MSRGHLNVLKGAYPGLHQLDEDLPVEATQTDILRGTCLRKSSGEWVKTAADAASQGAANTPGPIIYFSLHPQDEEDVTLSGVLSALPCTFPCEIETDQYDAGGTFAVGDYVVAGADGKIEDHADDLTACGVVTRSPYPRYVNDALAPASSPVQGARTGRILNVVSFWTIYVPNLSTA
jgi:hypothetical protein